MLSLNPKGRVQDEVYFPGGKTLYKEECDCQPGFPHWNIVLQEAKAGDITERIVFQTDEERLAEFFINIVCDDELQIDYDL